ncbi:hypothetical protein KX928_07200 [Roseobacter sp. YSTF-M11]|uniref:AAA+ family ATPase n=1 Tax=Roseobacter insulae TaxID=2859783 RepID=A0A9X1FUD8_9RHOB|nr:hypothetical protein [Roseobacter insulae]MBW4707569.1 hypothetical protein [Roseobacter insulae]
MKRISAGLITCLFCAAPVAAQDKDAPSMMERGAQQFLEGLLLEMEPALEGMRGFIDEMGPALTDLMGKIDDWSVYEAPEILPNGDIIIRRKPDKETEQVPEVQPQIDL